MNLFAILKVAVRALNRNKLRTALTMLGIIIGVGAVIVLVSIGQGAQAMVQDQINSMGTNMMFIMPGNMSFGGASLGAGAANTLTEEDVHAMIEESRPSPQHRRSCGRRVSWFSETKTGLFRSGHRTRNFRKFETGKSTRASFSRIRTCVLHHASSFLEDGCRQAFPRPGSDRSNDSRAKSAFRVCRCPDGEGTIHGRAGSGRHCHCSLHDGPAEAARSADSVD